MYVDDGLSKVEHRSLTLGEVLKGDRMAVSSFDIHFKGLYDNQYAS